MPEKSRHYHWGYRMRREIEFQSKGVTCRGWLVTPDQGEGPFPTLVMAGGWCYTKEIVMPQYAEKFAQAGIASLIFDYQNFGESDGEPRQHLDPWLQIEDYRNAISFAEGEADVDSTRIGAWGISYSGGHVLILGGIDQRVKCVVSNIPVVDGHRNLRIAHGEIRYRELRAKLIEERRRRQLEPGYYGQIAMSTPDPVEELANWPFPAVYGPFIALKETIAPRHEHWTTMESTDLLDAYTVFPYVRRIVNTPTLMIVAEEDDLAMWDLEMEAYEAILTSNKQMIVLKDTSHMSLYQGKTKVEMASEQTIPWLLENLVGEQAGSSATERE